MRSGREATERVHAALSPLPSVRLGAAGPGGTGASSRGGRPRPARSHPTAPAAAPHREGRGRFPECEVGPFGGARMRVAQDDRGQHGAEEPGDPVPHGRGRPAGSGVERVGERREQHSGYGHQGEPLIQEGARSGEAVGVSGTGEVRGQGVGQLITAGHEDRQEDGAGQRVGRQGDEQTAHGVRASSGSSHHTSKLFA
ncbi:hypothetical protein GCM10020000_18650 [Streptomyces olivoverticillatus]